MRILVLTPTFLPVVGGAELVLFEVYRRLVERHEVLLVTPNLAPNLLRQHASDEYRDAEVPFPVHRYEDRLSFMRIPGHTWSGGAIPPFSLSAVSATRDAVHEFLPDVLNVHYLMPTGLAGAMAEHWLGVRTVLTMNGRDVPGPSVPPLWRWWQRLLLALATDATYVSRYCRNAIYRRTKGRGRVIYNGVQIPPVPGDGRSLRRELSIPDHQPMIFTLGRLATEKRVDVLLRALQHYLQTGCRGTLVIGGTGPEEERLRKLATKLNVEANVRFAGFIPPQELPSYFDGCDLFVFHSTYETFGIVVAQAMSYGKPVVAANNTALPEVVGDAGLLADTGDWRGFGEAMARIANDDDLHSRLGQAGRSRAKSHFDWDRIAEQYEAVLARAAGLTPTSH